MLYAPDRHRHIWDTWCHFDGVLHHMFYLFMEDFSSPGEGVGHATSIDGVHWQEQADAILKSPEMDWLGSGAVWRVGDSFVMNYSQMNFDGVQTIFFATSKDLFTWTTQPEPLRVDARWYNDTPTGRWDCIYPLQLPDGSWQGFLTANPWTIADTLDGTLQRSVGHVRSADGLSWQAEQPPAFDWTGTAPSSMTRMTEVGAVEHIEGRFRLMLGSFGFQGDICGAYGFSADAIGGPYSPDPGNNRLLFSARQTMSYFPRFFRHEGGVLVNHHSVARDGSRSFAALKTAEVADSGRLYFGYWQGNEVLKDLVVETVFGTDPIVGEGVVEATDASLSISSRQGCAVELNAGVARDAFVLEFDGRMTAPPGGFGALGLHLGTRIGGVQINLQTHGQTAVFDTGAQPTGHQLAAGAVGHETVEKGITDGALHRIRVLAVREFLELYVDDELYHVYSLEAPADARISFSASDGRAEITDLRLWSIAASGGQGVQTKAT